MESVVRTALGDGDDERRGASTDRVDLALGYYRHLVKLQEYVARHLHEPFRLSEAALQIGVSPNWLSHLFQKKTGIRLSDWIRRERIVRAMELLRSSDRPICEVAASVGFRNCRTFERAFKKTAGISPSAYRKRHIPWESVAHSNFDVADAMSIVATE